MSRRTLFLTAAAVSLTFGSLPANAAMPLAGVTAIDTGSAIVRVQGTAPATGTAPAAATPPAATTDPAATAAPTGGKKAKKTASRQKEIDSSVESGTVPKRYRNSIPKQYQDLIPWSK